MNTTVLITACLVLFLAYSSYAEAKCNCYECFARGFPRKAPSRCCWNCAVSDCRVKNRVFKRGVPFRVRPCRVCVCHLGVIRCKDICRYRNLECPSVQEVKAANATCGTTCTSDYYCKFGQKCCSNGCGKKCVEPLGCRTKNKFYKNGQKYVAGMLSCECKGREAACDLQAAEVVNPRRN